MVEAMFNGAINEPLGSTRRRGDGAQAKSEEDMYNLQAYVDQLQAELASAKSEIEFAQIKEEDLQSRYEQALTELRDLRQRLDEASGHLRQEVDNHTATQAIVSAQLNDKSALEERLAKAQKESDGAWKRVRSMEEKLSNLESAEFIKSSTDQVAEQQNQESPMLAAAYNQISVLNTQLAHLYTELTMARTEAQQLRAAQSAPRDGSGETTVSQQNAVEAQKHGRQIADLVRDIRHLQLDLEYHQQKLDETLTEKQQCRKDLAAAQGELKQLRAQLEERDQLLKHREVDLLHAKQARRNEASGHSGQLVGADSALTALRAEAAAKDSALIVSHYELHKEKLIRDKLEQKNIKLMERMQKLMMIVETMRKDNVNLERMLASKERSHETKELQLRQVAAKAKQLQKFVRASERNRSQDRSKDNFGLELEAPPSHILTALPPVDRGGRPRSGASTPRGGACTPRAVGQPPQSPYGRGLATLVS